VALTASGTGTEEAPLAPRAPVTPPASPAPSTSIAGSSTCVGQGAGGQGGSGSAGHAAALLETVSEHALAVSAARTAMVAGPVDTTAADPATRPD
jgi:hypothetical protein